MRAERLRGLILGGVIGPTAKLPEGVFGTGRERGWARPGDADSGVLGAGSATVMCRSEVCVSEWKGLNSEESADELRMSVPRPDSRRDRLPPAGWATPGGGVSLGDPGGVG